MNEFYEIKARSRVIQVRRGAAVVLTGVVLAAVLAAADAPAAKPVAIFTATTENVNNAREPIQIVVRNWSTDAERDPLLAAWNTPNPPAPASPKPAVEAITPDAGRGRGGRGGRGAAAAAPPAHQTPESALAAALDKAPAVGDLWSSESVGYSLRYAVRIPEQDGRERIILITDRRLGEFVNSWKPVGPGAATKYEFSLIELRVNARGEGEGKISPTGNIVVDDAAKTFALENYAALPVVLRNVKRRAN
ncbi:MAG: hypothetical protein ABSB15_09800 [Bryobacteraceae bacterium]